MMRKGNLRRKICQIQPQARLIVFIAISFMFISSAANAQRQDWKVRIDDMVHRADSLFFHSNTMFYAERLLGKDSVIKETWHYTTENDKVLVFQVRYLQQNKEITEVYYVDRNELICMEKIQAPNAAEFMDEVHSGELHFLRNSSLYVSVSYGQDPVQRNRTTGIECLNNFNNRWAELMRNISIVQATRKRS